MIDSAKRFGFALFLFSCQTQKYVECLGSCMTQSVMVWDNVLCSESRAELHKTTSQLGSSRHFLFTRPIDPQKSGLIEKTLDAILSEMDDKAKYVEFWARQEWRSIEAHADVDEMLAKSEDAEGGSMERPFRFPQNGHVLYLHRGEEVRGPTCIFPGRQSGGDLLNPTKGCDDRTGVELVTVPAVPGRLLRFQGDYLHAVPRPTDLWMKRFVLGAPDYSPEEMWGRSVILFNTWGEHPPLDVRTRSDIDEVKPYYSLCEARSDWKDVYDETDADDGNFCGNEDFEGEYVKAKIWLLGNERRRNYRMRTLPLMAPESLVAALEEESKVRRTTLRQT